MTPTLILPVWIRPTICWDLPIASSAIMSARWRTINKPPNLNPHHRGALAYLGETYPARGRETHAIKNAESPGHRMQTGDGNGPRPLAIGLQGIA